ncbi:MAG: acyltransferase family protein [Janthinobacterium lividum]
MKLQRITAHGRWFPEIDGLRFVAIFAVLLVHILGMTLNSTPGGFAADPHSASFILHGERLARGVQLFFVISGFILAQPFLNELEDGGRKVSLKAFYRRRLTRLEPPYILALLLYFFGFVLLHAAPLHVLLLSLLSSIFYVHNFIFINLKPINPVTWSLEVEVQFYLLAPLLARVFRIPSLLWRRALLVTGTVVLASLPWHWLDRHGIMFPVHACYFVLGYLLADLRIHLRPDWSHPLWDAVSVVCFPVFFFIDGGHFERLLLSALLLLCFAGAMLGPLSRQLLARKWIALFGGMCYSIYLLHMLVFSLATRVTRHVMVFHGFYANYALHVVLLVPVVLAVSMAYFLLIERPCMDPHWPGKLLQWFRGDRRSAA